MISITNSKYSEEQIVELLLNKDELVIDILYNQYSAALYGVVLRIVLKEDVAEDVLQEAFVKIWKNATSYDKSKGRLFTWMLNICRNTAIDVTRTKNFKTSRKISGDEFLLVNNEQTTVSFKPEFVGLKELLNNLKDDHKMIIDLAYFSGMTQTEIAEELSIPLGTVKTRMRAALNHLREFVKEPNL